MWGIFDCGWLWASDCWFCSPLDRVLELLRSQSSGAQLSLSQSEQEVMTSSYADLLYRCQLRAELDPESILRADFPSRLDYTNIHMPFSTRYIDCRWLQKYPHVYLMNMQELDWWGTPSKAACRTTEAEQREGGGLALRPMSWGPHWAWGSKLHKLLPGF